jgi:alkanesulfonate monooxygenase SsuD/methylene tetrahydromethanopterin reductase-like flavin-dependent oxidoreductase (luciferase family)
VELRARAERAEAVGFDSLWGIDHLLIRWAAVAGQYGWPVTQELAAEEPEGVWECWSLLAALAAVTTRVDLGTLLSCTGFRNPAMLARIAATVDEISGGRLILGLAAGDVDDEHRSFGIHWDHRVGRFEEALRIISPLLREGQVDFEGTYYAARDCELRPRGAQRAPGSGGPPLVIGALASGPRMLGLTAQYANIWNGFLSFGRSYPDAVVPLREAVDRACATTGREPASLARTVAICVAKLGRTVPDADPLQGRPSELAENLRQFAREGISHVQIDLVPSSLQGIEAFAQVLERLDQG